jgi:hypothetical protein
MRLEKASHKAIKYACINFHYAKSVPVNVFGYSVFNDKNEWCGVVLYGTGATPNIGSQYKLKQGQIVELVRMALNGKQESTTKAMALSIKLLKKNLPLIKMIVSYADIDQNHYGIIYQATNWFFVGNCNENTRTGFIINGKKIHNKSLHGMGKEQSLKGAKSIDINATEFISKGKRKYIYPLDKSLLPLCKSLAKPYPKNAAVAHLGERLASSQEGAFDATVPLQLTGSKQGTNAKSS